MGVGPDQSHSIVVQTYGAKEGLAAGWINSLFQTRDGRLWAASTTGLYLVSPSSDSNTTHFQLYDARNGLCKSLGDVTEDRRIHLRNKRQSHRSASGSSDWLQGSRRRHGHPHRLGQSRRRQEPGPGAGFSRRRVAGRQPFRGQRRTRRDEVWFCREVFHHRGPPDSLKLN